MKTYKNCEDTFMYMIRCVRNNYFQTQGTESFARVRCFEIRIVIYHIFTNGIYIVACNAEFLKSISMRWLATLKPGCQLQKKKKMKIRVNTFV